jgi:hypothetical protein
MYLVQKVEFINLQPSILDGKNGLFKRLLNLNNVYYSVHPEKYSSLDMPRFVFTVCCIFFVSCEDICHLSFLMSSKYVEHVISHQIRVWPVQSTSHCR